MATRDSAHAANGGGADLMKLAKIVGAFLSWAAEIAGKVVIPISIAIIASNWNAERTKTEASLEMIKIAVNVVRSEPNPGTDPLREWAILVLKDPTNPPPLTGAASAFIQVNALPGPGTAMGTGFAPSIGAFPEVDAPMAPDPNIDLLPPMPSGGQSSY